MPQQSADWEPPWGLGGDLGGSVITNPEGASSVTRSALEWAIEIKEGIVILALFILIILLVYVFMAGYKQNNNLFYRDSKGGKGNLLENFLITMRGFKGVSGVRWLFIISGGLIGGAVSSYIVTGQVETEGDNWLGLFKHI